MYTKDGWLSEMYIQFLIIPVLNIDIILRQYYVGKYLSQLPAYFLRMQRYLEAPFSSMRKFNPHNHPDPSNNFHLQLFIIIHRQ